MVGFEEGWLLECVPNVAEGRDAGLVRSIGDAFASAGAILADTHVDADHHRAVYTLFGSADQLCEGVGAAITLIDGRIELARSDGAHPRIGALDVVPIVPLAGYLDGGADLASAVLCADDVCRTLALRGVPAIRYGSGAPPPPAGGVPPSRTGQIRAGGAIESRIAEGDLAVAAGPLSPHAALGATMVGVRDVLVAFNVELDTSEVAMARHVASVLREAGGGLPGVRALGLAMARRGTVQVSTNIERWREAGPAEVLERVLDLASVLHVPVASAELVGLAPRDAIHDLGIACRRNSVELRCCREPALEIRARLARERLAHRH